MSDQQNQGGQENKIEHVSITLPKGGGAISGIGEKFQANAVTGTGSFSVPLPLSPGRGGFSPQLGLSYDSGGGNSEFGLGWNVGLPSISRKTGKQLPYYEDYRESDVFILSGAEDLVPVLEKRGERWERVIKEEEGRKIYPYRPRIEGLFAKIEKVVDGQTKEAYWRATTKEGITSVYGRSPDCRISDPARPRRIFKWLIEESFDAKGNRILYQYKREDRENVPKSSAEMHRQKGPAPAQCYLKRVLYTPYDDNADRFHMQLVFDYGEHGTDTPGEAVTWPARMDPFSTYKPGFEVRTHRLCRRIMMFHNFTTGEKDEWQLVKSTELTHTPGPVATYLNSIRQKGYKLNPSSATEPSYEIKSLPPLELKYTGAEIQNTMQTVDEASLENLPVGLDNQGYQWIDLEGEGLPGILSQQPQSLMYKENLGGGKFGSMRNVATLPQPLSIQGAMQITDIDGDGRQELILKGPGVNGYFEYKEGRWETFHPFKKMPLIDWNDPNMKVLDVNGDGHADLLITENHLFRWYPSKAKEGYDKSLTVPVASDEAKGPRLVFADMTQSIYLSDMSGDGLTDIVRIRNGQICYWPNLGHGRFGARVTMKNAPRFTGDNARFNQQYIKLGDIDGSGIADIFYFGNGKVEYWLNESGNGWSDRGEIKAFLPVDSLSTINLIDLTGKGTLSLVWSSSRSGMHKRQLSYIDLMGEKPHLLCEIDNNMGKITRSEYASSTKFYLDDKAAGKPWITKLPFPVHVLTRTETIDLIGGSRLVSQYKYHHGYFDGREREFRGFGMVETIDTEGFEIYSGDPKEYVAPVLTKTWFHTGAFLQAGKISKQYEREYFQGDKQAFLLPDTVIEERGRFDFREVPGAYRALKSKALRQEIYELGKEVPYQVTESSFIVKRLQARGDNKHAVFFTHAGEAITFHYEQNAGDPRISHRFTVEVDEYGNVLKQGQLVYPRRAGAMDVKPEQEVPHATLSVSGVINETEEFYRLGVPYESRSYELGPRLLVSAGEQMTLAVFKQAVDEALNNTIAFHKRFSDTGPLQARLFTWTRNLFWNEQQDAALPVGRVTEKALSHHREMAAFTPGLVESTYGPEVTEESMLEAGYVFKEGHWWNPGLIQHYTNGHFYMPCKTEDPFGGTVEVAYDEYKLVPVQTVDALGNTSTAEVDYRTFKPWQLTGPNGNMSEAVTDPLGLVIATSIYGAEDSEAKGDSPIFNDDGTPFYQIQTGASVVDLLANPEKYLQQATTFLYYDVDAWMNRQQAPHSIQIARETHVSELSGEETTRLQKAIAYSDGFGRELQSKVMVEPGYTWVKQVDGSFREEQVDVRWLVSGRKVFNNKEKPIKEYEPFYSATHDYEKEEFFDEYGVTPVIHYDPLLRVVRTDTPKGFFSKVEFTPWQIRQFDENDTVKESEYYGRYEELPAEEKSALDKAVAHYDTPKAVWLDTLGREFISIEYLAGNSGSREELITYIDFNITGQPLSVTNPRQYANGSGVKGSQYIYDMQMVKKDEQSEPEPQIIGTISVDGGNDRGLNNVMGNPYLVMDSRGHKISTSYDVLQRPIATKVEGNGLNNVVERLIYGESQPNPEVKNLRGQVYRHYDQSGLTTVDSYSFMGKPLNTRKQVRVEYKEEADWRDGSGWEALLEPEAFAASTKLDALGRTVEQRLCDGSITMPEYHQSGKLNKVKVQLKNETGFTDFVTGITYNPKGQREKIIYGNGTETVYGYEPEAFRLSSLITNRVSDSKELQNINYTYDPVGNIVRIEDSSHSRVFNNNQQVDPVHQYMYDSLYRLIEAGGREHVGLNVPDYDTNTESFKQSSFIHLENTNDANKLANYTRKYSYDFAGNLNRVRHIASESFRSFTRDIEVDEFSNRAVLKSDENPVDFTQHFDYNGNCVQLEHLRKLEWNYRDNISSATVIKRATEPDDAEYYVYDASGSRVRKVTERYLGDGQVEVEEKLYLGGVEIKRIQRQSSLTLERSSLHIMDDKSRIGVVHHWIRDDLQREVESASWIGVNRVRYQYGNHLGSASLEADGDGRIISYEEYFAYGGTSFIAGISQKEVKLKEYRYTGKERDDTTGLYYYEARYYCPWMGRFMSVDPARDGANWYAYCGCNPVMKIDPAGLADEIFQLPLIKKNKYFKPTGPLEVIGNGGVFFNNTVIELLNIVPGVINGVLYTAQEPDWSNELVGGINDSITETVDYLKDTPPDQIGKDMAKVYSDPETYEKTAAGVVLMYGLHQYSLLKNQGKGIGGAKLDFDDFDDFTKDLSLNSADDAASTFSGTAKAWKSGATPNSTYIQYTDKGLVKAITQYDKLGNAAVRTDFIQTGKHMVTINGTRVNLANHIHQHAKIQFTSPKGNTYLKDMVRLADENLNPLSEWVHVK